jgi:hypothetical protein
MLAPEAPSLRNLEHLRLALARGKLQTEPLISSQMRCQNDFSASLQDLIRSVISQLQPKPLFYRPVQQDGDQTVSNISQSRTSKGAQTGKQARSCQFALCNAQ